MKTIQHDEFHRNKIFSIKVWERKMMMNARRYVLVFLSLLMFISMLSLGGIAQSLEDHNHPAVEPGKATVGNEHSDGEKGSTRGTPPAPGSVDGDCRTTRDSSQDGGIKGDTDRKTDASSSADDGKQHIKERDNGKTKENADVTAMVSYSPMDEAAGKSEEKPEGIQSSSIPDTSMPEVQHEEANASAVDSFTEERVEANGETIRDVNDEQDIDNEQIIDESAVIHTVLFTGQNNVLLETQQVEDGKQAEEPNDPAAPEGFTFWYWYDGAGNGLPFEFTTPITGDMEIRAHYIEIVFEQDNGEATDEEVEHTSSDEEPAQTPVEEEPKSVLPGEEQAEVVSELPRVEVEYAFEGGVLLEGAKVTLTAHVYSIPEDTLLSFQWQNDAAGRFEDVSGATGQTYTFYADAGNSGCQWRVKVEGRGA